MTSLYLEQQVIDSRGGPRNWSSQAPFIALAHPLCCTIRVFEPAENLSRGVVFASETGNLSQCPGLKTFTRNDAATCYRVLLEMELSA